MQVNHAVLLDRRSTLKRLRLCLRLSSIGNDKIACPFTDNHNLKWLRRLERAANGYDGAGVADAQDAMPAGLGGEGGQRGRRSGSWCGERSGSGGGVRIRCHITSHKAAAQD